MILLGGGVRDRGCAWWGACMTGGMHSKGVCMVGVYGVGGGHAWWVGCAWQGGHVWPAVVCGRGACMAGGGMRGGGGEHAWQEKRPLQRAMESYWNAVLFSYSFQPKFGLIRGWRLPLGNLGSSTDTKLWIQYFLYQGAPIPHEIEKKRCLRGDCH